MSKLSQGFTLLEVMLSIAIFSTLIFLATLIFSQATEQHQRAKQTANDFDAVQHTMLMLENDLMQYVPRKNRQTAQSFSGEKDGVIFTTQVRDPALPFRAAFMMATVHWYIKDGRLFRATRRVPDGKEENRPQVFLHNVAHFTATMVPSENNSAYAIATISLERENKDQLTRRFILPGGSMQEQAIAQQSGAAK